jgi:hypothetical protein
VKPMTRAIAVALIQILLVGSLGGKLLYDRRTRPQAWFKTARYDPNLPIRGRYLSLQIEVTDPRSPEEVESKFKSEIALYERQRFNNFYQFGQECGSIELRGETPVAKFEDDSAQWNCDNLSFVRRHNGDHNVLQLSQQVLFFISDTAQDPTGVRAGDELWVLATIPRKGPPRPIALGIKKAGETSITRLNLN